jgi:hypothetical protein
VNVAFNRLLVLLLEKRLETTDDVVTMIEVSVDKRGRVDGEEDAIKEGVGGRQVERRVGFVRSLVEEAIGVDNLGDLVLVAESVIRFVDVDGQVCGVPGVGEPDGNDDRKCDQHSEKVIDRRKEWGNERRGGGSNDIPVKSRDWVQAQAGLRTSDCGELDIVGRNPGHPRKVGQERGDIIGEPEVHEHSPECIEEETKLGDLPSIGDRVLFGVE